MKIFGQDTGKGRNHDYDPAEERRQSGTCCVCGRTIADPDNPEGGDCPRCGRIVAEK